MTRTDSPTWTATRTEHDKATRVTVYRDGVETARTSSETMRYVEVLVNTKSGKISARSQKVGGTPNPRAGYIRIPVTDMVAPADADLHGEPTPAVMAKAIRKATTTRPGGPATAATIARDHGIDPYKFRVYLRKHGIARDPKSMRAAAKKFASGK